MREETSVDYRYSSSFWVKKALLLIGLFLLAWLFWWLWQWEADSSDSSDSVAIVDTDNDGLADSEDIDDDGDGFNDAEELEAGSDPLDSNSTPEAVDETDTDGDGFSDEDETKAGSDINDEDETPENYDADGDGFSWAAETEAGSDPDVKASTPDTLEDDSDNGTPTNDNPSVDGPSFTIGSLSDVTPTVTAINGEDCVYEYTYEVVSTVTVYDNCLPTTLGNTDFVWNHNGNYQLTSTPTAYDCAGATTLGSTCTHGNGVLEVWSMTTAVQNAISNGTDINGDYVVVHIKDADGTNELNAVSDLGPVIESIKGIE